MATPSLFPLFMKAAVGIGSEVTQVIEGVLSIVHREEVSVSLADEDLVISWSTDEDLFVSVEDPITVSPDAAIDESLSVVVEPDGINIET
jgi:hypothetical protein